MSRAIKNSKAYDSVDAEVTIAGILTNLVEIEYSTEQEHQVNHTLGANASSWSKGKKTHTCRAVFMVEDIKKMERAAGGDLLRIKPFDINVTLVNEFNDIINDTVTAKFQDQGRSITGDMGLNREYNLLVLGIDYNNAQS